MEEFPRWDDLPRYIVAGIAFEVNISSSEDFSVSSEIIDAATEGLAVPAAYPFMVRMTNIRLKQDERVTRHLLFHYLIRGVQRGLDMRHPF